MVLAAEGPREMRGAVESGGKGDLGDGPAPQQRIHELAGAFVEPPAQDVAGDGLALALEQHAQVASGDVQRTGHAWRRQVRVAEMHFDKALRLDASRDDR